MTQKNDARIFWPHLDGGGRFEQGLFFRSHRDQELQLVVILAEKSAEFGQVLSRGHEISWVGMVTSKMKWSLGSEAKYLYLLNVHWAHTSTSSR
jgi:hypothetical protein